MTGGKESELTVAAVVKYAEKLRHRADKMKAGDVWARPYSPSDAAARKLSNRLGPQKALEALARRVMEIDHQASEHDRIAKRAELRHIKFLREVENRERARRETLTYGQRIDDAILKLSIISEAPATRLSSDMITGGSQPDTTTARLETVLENVATTARVCAETVEGELDIARRRAICHLGVDNVTRLQQLSQNGLSPHQISVIDPSQGSPARITKRLSQL